MPKKLVMWVGSLALVLGMFQPMVSQAGSGPLWVNTTDLTGAIVGLYYSSTIYFHNESNYAVNAQLAGLPSGISVNGTGATGNVGILTPNNTGSINIAGTPVAAGNYVISVTLDNQAGGSTYTTNVYMTVNAAQPAPRTCTILYFTGQQGVQVGEKGLLSWSTNDCDIAEVVGTNAANNAFTAPISTQTFESYFVGPFTSPGTYYYKLIASNDSSIDVTSGPIAAYASITVVGSATSNPPAPALPAPPGSAPYYGNPPRNVSYNGTVYLVNGISRSPYTSAAAFLSYNFNSWSNVVPATQADLNLPVTTYMPNGSSSLVPYFVPPRNGSLINDKGTIYIITSDGIRQGFASEQVFRGMGYSFANVIPGDSSFMVTAGPLNSSAQVHPSGSVVNDNGTLYYMQSSGARLGIPSMAAFNSWGFKLREVVAANSYDRLVPVGGTLQFRMTNQFGL
jgi:hypothetical protein